MAYESNGSLEDNAEIQKPTQENSKTKKKPEKKTKSLQKSKTKRLPKKETKSQKIKEVTRKKSVKNQSFPIPAQINSENTTVKSTFKKLVKNTLLELIDQ